MNGLLQHTIMYTVKNDGGQVNDPSSYYSACGIATAVPDGGGPQVGTRVSLYIK